jgi:hypothetical protein
LRDGIRYCWGCGGDQTRVGPPGRTSEPSTSGDTNQQENKTDKSETDKSSFGRPQSVPHGKVLTFEQFLKKKTSKENVTHFRPTKKAKSDPNELVMVYIGIKRFKDGCLKTVKGKRLPIRVPKSATCRLILQKATEQLLTGPLMLMKGMICCMKMEALHFLCLEPKISLNWKSKSLNWGGTINELPFICAPSPILI